MAAINPVAKGTSGWLHPNHATAIWSIADVAAVIVPNKTSGRTTRSFNVNRDMIDDGDTYTLTTWRGPIPHTTFLSLDPDQAINPTCTLSGTSLVITFQTDGANRSGYLFIDRARGSSGPIT